MNSSWIIRGLLAFIALQAGICTIFLADEWAPLQLQEESIFSRFLSATHMGRRFVIDDAPDRERTRLARPIEDGDLRLILRVDVDEDPEREFDSYPLSPADWHVLLSNTHEAGAKVLAIESPISWENAEEYYLRVLDLIIGRFEQAVLTVDLRRAPVGQARPVWIHRSGIPVENVRGNTGLFPRVNRIVLPPSATGAPNVLFSFRIIESESSLDIGDGGLFPAADELRFLPAFAVWDDILIPSFPVAVAMAHYGVSPDQVRVNMGKHIRIGDAGPIIPIDEFGQLAYPLVNRPLFSSTRAYALSKDFVAGESPDETPRLVLFADATRANPAPWGNPARLVRFISSIDALPRPREAVIHPRFPLWGEILFLALVSLAAPAMLSVPRIFMPLTSLAVVLLSLLGLGFLLYFQKTWMPLAPVLVTGVVGGVLAPRFSAHLPPREALPA